MRKIYAILVLFLTMGAGANIWGQAPGNTCATAVNLTLPAIGNTITTGAQTTCGRGNNVLAGFSSVSTSYGGGEDAYYSITVPAGGGNYTFTYAASGATWKILSIHSGCAPTTGNTVGGFVTGGATGGTTTTTLAAGSYILVIDTWPAPACGAFTLNITRNAPPPNPCASAINIPSVPVTNQALVCNATAVPGALNATNVPTACGAASNFYKGGQDAIYTFTPTASGNHTITYNGVTYSSIFVYSGACPASGGTCVGSVGTAAASQTLTVNMTAGVLYYIWFDTWPAPNSPCPGTFSIAPPAGAPANDLVCNATSISCGGTVSGTTIGATNSGTGENQTCGTNQSQPGVWYVVPGNGQTMTASLCATAWDSKISVFSGTNCSTLTCVGGNDDNGPACAGASASFSWASVSGLNYYILVHGFSSSSAFNLNLTCVASYNPCASTPTLSCGTPVTQTFASGSGASWSPGTCGFTTPGEERVFLFTAPTTGTYTINQTASYAYIDYFFKPVSGGCNATGWTCIDDLFGAMTSTGFALTAGVQYYILADPETTAGGNATFSITCPTPCAGTTVTVNMNDTFGDGWNGANLSIVDVNTNAVVGTYTFATGFSSSQTACLPDGCYRVVLNAGAFPTEVGWSLVSGATTIASASSPTAAPFNTTFTIGTGTCTPPANNNCTSATVVDLGVNPSQTISGSSTASTNDPVILGQILNFLKRGCKLSCLAGE